MNGTESGNVTSIFDDSLMPLTLHPFQVIFRSTALVIGVPLNIFVAWVLISSRRLQYACHAIWFGVAISNLMHLLPIAAEFAISFWGSYVACQFLVVVAGKPYVILLINLLLATADRFVQTKWPLFHKKHVTVARVIATQLVTSSVTFLLLTAHFWALNEPVRCAFDPWMMRLNLALMLILTLLCIVAKFIVYFTLQKSTQEDRSHAVSVGLVSLPQQQDSLTCAAQNAQTDQAASTRDRQRALRTHQGRNIRRMERRASMTLVFSLIPLCLSTLLMYVYLLCRFLCHQFFGNCHTLNAMEVYCRELVLLHVSTNLLSYLTRSREFQNVVSNMFHCFRTLVPPPSSNYS